MRCIQQLSDGVIGPVVVRTQKLPRIAAALREDRATMTTDVGESPDFPVPSMDDQDRLADVIESKVVAGLAYFFYTSDTKPVPGKQFVTLGLQPVRIGIEGAWKRKPAFIRFVLDRSQGLQKH